MVTIMKITNLTPHPLNIEVNGEMVTIPPTGTIARVTQTTKEVGTIAGITVVENVFGEVENLPPADGTLMVVSALVKGRTNQENVFNPAEYIRDEQGHIVGCKALTM